jgi:hypothetical protein
MKNPQPKDLYNMYAMGPGVADMLYLSMALGNAHRGEVMYRGVISAKPFPEKQGWSKRSATAQELGVAEDFSKKHSGQFNKGYYPPDEPFNIIQAADGRELMMFPLFDRLADDRPDSKIHLLLLREKGREWKEYSALVTYSEEFTPVFDFDGNGFPEFANNSPAMGIYKFFPKTEIYLW